MHLLGVCRILMELGVREDPVWHYLSNLQRSICQVLRQDTASSSGIGMTLLLAASNKGTVG